MFKRPEQHRRGRLGPRCRLASVAVVAGVQTARTAPARPASCHRCRRGHRFRRSPTRSRQRTGQYRQLPPVPPGPPFPPVPDPVPPTDRPVPPAATGAQPWAWQTSAPVSPALAAADRHGAPWSSTLGLANISTSIAGLGCCRQARGTMVLNLGLGKPDRAWVASTQNLSLDGTRAELRDHWDTDRAWVASTQNLSLDGTRAELRDHWDTDRAWVANHAAATMAPIRFVRWPGCLSVVGTGADHAAATMAPIRFVRWPGCLSVVGTGADHAAATMATPPASTIDPINLAGFTLPNHHPPTHHPTRLDHRPHQPRRLHPPQSPPTHSPPHPPRPSVREELDVPSAQPTSQRTPGSARTESRSRGARCAVRAAHVTEDAR